MQNSIKLHAYIAQQGYCSRRKAEELIQKHKVLVNHQPAHIGQRIDPTKDSIIINGKPLIPTTNYAYYLIYKPAGYISTTADEKNRKTVLDYFYQINTKLPHKIRLYPVGRLDKDSEGLMLLTNDGGLTQKMTHPSYQVKKTYYVLLDRQPNYKAIEHLKKGVKLQDGFTKKAAVELIADNDPYLKKIAKLSGVATKTQQDKQTWLSITIKEGRNHQVRRMLRRVGYNVIRLVRVKMDDFDLDQLKNKKCLQIN